MHVENIDLSVPMIEYLILEKCKKDTKLLDEETLPELTNPVAPKYQMNHISETISFSPPLLLRCEKKSSNNWSHTAQPSKTHHGSNQTKDLQMNDNTSLVQQFNRPFTDPTVQLSFQVDLSH